MNEVDARVALRHELSVVERLVVERQSAVIEAVHALDEAYAERQRLRRVLGDAKTNVLHEHGADYPDSWKRAW